MFEFGRREMLQIVAMFGFLKKGEVPEIFGQFLGRNKRRNILKHT
jgi:hypothetical protein